MSASECIPNPLLVEFHTLLTQLTMVDNQLRSRAEQSYQTVLKERGDYAVQGLLSVLSSVNVEAHIRQLAAVLLRRCLIDDEESVFFRLAANSRNALLQELLRLLREEANTTIRLRVSDIAGELGGGIIEPKDWPELAPSAYLLCKSPHGADREVGLSLIGLLADSQIAQNEALFLPALVEILQLNFVDVSPSSVGGAEHGKGVMLALKTLNYAVQSLRAPSQLDQLRPLVPVLFQSFGTLIQQFLQRKSNSSSGAGGESESGNGGNGGERALSLFAEHLVDMADHTPDLFAHHLESFLPPLLDCVESDALASLSQLKFLLVEFLVTLCHGVPRRIKKTRGPQGQQRDYFISRFFPLCVQMMTCIAHDPQWVVSESVEESHYDSSPSDVGESALRRATASLGVRHTYALISSLIGACLADASSWERQCAGLQCVALYMEVTSHIQNAEQLAVHRKEVLHTLLAFMAHSHARVKHCALYAAAQFLLFHGGALDDEQALQILQAITRNVPVAVNPSPRVRRNAMIALIQWIDVLPSSLLTFHQDDAMTGNTTSPASAAPLASTLLGVICQALREGPTIVQESCVSAIISIAESTKNPSAGLDRDSDEFTYNAMSSSVDGKSSWLLHYPQIMPILKELLVYSQRQGLESLWSQALECITVVGESAGKLLFYQDALELMELLRQVQNQLEPHSSLEAVLIKAWVRIARCLGSEFLPYLHETVQKLFHAMSQDVTVPTSAAALRRAHDHENDDFEGDEEDEEDDEDEDDDVQMIETDDGWVAVRTTLVEEQASAVQMILLLAEKLQEHFYPYVAQTVTLLDKLIASPHEDIRSFAIAALPELVRATGKALPSNRAPLGELSSYCLGLLVRAVERESALDLVMTALQTMRQILLYAAADWAALAAQSVRRERARREREQDNGSGKGECVSVSLSPASSSGARSLSLSLPGGTTAPAGLTGGAESEEQAKPRFLRVLDDAQLLTLSQCLKAVLRDSLQRRAVLKAEATAAQRENATNAADEDDLEQEQQFFQECLELHFSLSEVLNALFQTHGARFFPCYLAEWHEIVSNLSHPFCLPEDRRFAFLVLSDVLQFGVTSGTCGSGVNGGNNAVSGCGCGVSGNNEGVTPRTPHTPHSQAATSAGGGVATAGAAMTSEEYLHGVLPVLIESCTQSQDLELKRTAAYAIGIAFELHAHLLINLVPSALTALKSVVTAPLLDPEDYEEHGLCVDNAVAAVGIITEKTLLLQVEFHQVFLFQQWMQCLPLKNDLEEGEKALRQLLRLLTEQRAYFQANVGLLASAVSVFTQVVEQRIVPRTLLQDCAKALYNLTLKDDVSAQVMNFLTSDQHNRIQLVLAKAQEDGVLNLLGAVSTSPLATAPIYDVLMQRQFQ